MSVLNLYCAGGASINIGNNFVKYHSKKHEGYAEVRTHFIDTSKSNLTDNIPQDCVYLVDNVDGSGKVRSSNYNIIAESAQEILHTFKPADVNVVLHSASGGTGSTVGPVLVSELLSRGETVIVIMIGSTSSKIEVENTIKTLKSYEIISQKRGLPVVAHYRENSVDSPRGTVDSDIKTAILMLTSIFSGDNRELDSSDLKNFVNYHKVTAYTPRLVSLDFASGNIELGKGHSLVSLVTLVDDSTASDITIPVEYQTVGFIPSSIKEAIDVPLPIHVYTVAGYFNPVIDSLERKLKTYEETRKVAVEKSIAIESETEHTDIGLVL